MNSQRSSTTKFTPNELDFNLKHVSQNRIMQAIQNEPQDEDDVELKRESAASNVTEERRKWKLRYDKKH